MPSSFASFLEKSKTYQTIPITKCYKIDTFTPIRLFQALKKDAVYLLESHDESSSWSRYSFIGLNPIYTIKEEKDAFIMKDRKGKELHRTDCFPDIFRFSEERLKAAVPDLPLPFTGGAVGYISYDAVSLFEQLPLHRESEAHSSKCELVICETIAAYDHIEKELSFISYISLEGAKEEKALRQKYDEAENKLDGYLQQLKNENQADSIFLPPIERAAADFSAVDSNYTKQEFTKIVEKIQEYIHAGDIFQGVLSQKFSVPISISGFDLYRILRNVNPSPYLFYLKTGDGELVGSSPERLIHAADGHLEIHPIAGTRKRGETKEEDDRLCRELLHDEKERAEHLMLVDLARNDIGKAAEYHSVKTDHFMEPVFFSHVMHLLSKVTGRLKKGTHPAEALMAAFPAGTVSGAPKIRAMEILKELENEPRGQYAGCVAYIGFDGNIDSCITIRTAAIKDGKAYVQAGAGIVADSVPELEYEETQNKASALLKAIELAEAYFREEDSHEIHSQAGY
ncbi:anthranilate synthase component I [Metabacillus sp. GX 13764]|uniref:anthranilate synthase component I n=1 Tax=Metabacillus kandeliae TaxID=2900151 RepID=UPI001E36C988|nr:anthranilate synthase component I [Metabacillus kandeliae]MCD7033368.1 anthranilate synthase component I [Metabacillus kandeliae]